MLRMHFKREDRHPFVLRWTPVFLDDLVDELRDGRLKPHVSTLRADQRGDLLEAIEFCPPRLRVRDRLELPTSATLGTFFWMLFHSVTAFFVSSDRPRPPGRTSER